MSVIHAPGYSVRETARRFHGTAFLRAAAAALLLAIGLGLGALGAREVGVLFIGAGLLVGWEARKKWRLGHRFKVGAVAEERVGSRLGKLEELGWLVSHDVPKGGGGNVDHLVQSPGVSFVVETKVARRGSKERAQVLRHAEWAARRYGEGREIVPVLCVHRSKEIPELIGGVYIVGAARLVDFMLDRG